MKYSAYTWILLCILLAPLGLAGQVPRFERVVEYGSPYQVLQQAMAIDSTDHLYVAGNFTGQLCLQDTCLYAPAPDAQSGYILSFDPSGAIRWMKLIGQGDDVRISGLEVGTQGVHLVANFYDSNGSLTIGDSVWSVPGRGAIGATINFQGKLRGDYVIAQARVDRMTLDPEGKLLIAGFFRNNSTPLLDAVLTKESSAIESFWARINPAGFVEQTQVFQCPAISIIERIEANAAGEVFLAGLMEEWIVIAGDTLWSMADNPLKRDVFLVKLSAQKELVWARVGTPISAMSLHNQNQLIVTGNTNSTMIWGDSTLEAGYFLVALGADGEPEWVSQSPGFDPFRISGMAIKDDRIYTHLWHGGPTTFPDTSYFVEDQLMILRHDARNGRLVWHKEFGEDDVQENPGELLVTQNHSLVCGGEFITYLQNFTYLDSIQVVDRYPIDGFGPWHYIGITGPDTLFSTSVYFETESRPSWNAYPNPTRHTLYITGDQAGQPVKLSLMDLQGRAWQQEFLIWSEDSYPIDVSHLPDGIYFLHIQTNTAQTVLRLIKQP